MSKPLHVLLTRTDRLGDVLLTLPALDYLRKSAPHLKITFLYNDKLRSTLQPFLEERGIESLTFINSPQEPLSPSILSTMDAALFFITDNGLLFKTFKSKVPIRVGAYSSPLSFVLLSQGLRQKRSLAKKNEVDHNIDLVDLFLDILNIPKTSKRSHILLPPDKNAATEVKNNLELVKVDLSQPYLVLHPGMGGSAVNLSTRGYTQLIHTVKQLTTLPIVLSKGPAHSDAHLIDSLLEHFPTIPVVSGLSLPGLMELFRHSKLVIAPSTGPLHLAHLAGAPVLGLYPPLQNQSAKRWGPKGGNTHVTLLTPDLDCPAKRRCLDSKCGYYLCMDPLSSKPILGKTLTSLLN